jgi:hypothetical protein
MIGSSSIASATRRRPGGDFRSPLSDATTGGRGRRGCRGFAALSPLSGAGVGLTGEVTIGRTGGRKPTTLMP